MAFSKLESKMLHEVVGAFVAARRPPVHIRPQLDLAYRVTGQSVEIFEVRPRWRGTPGETMEHPVARATYVRTRDIWRIYWMRADLKWHRYEPAGQVGRIEQVLSVIAEDRHACFFG